MVERDGERHTHSHILTVDTFYFFFSDDLSPKLIPHRHRDDLHLPPRTSRPGEANPARASYHVRFAQHAGKSPSQKPPALPPKQALSGNSYEGGRALSSGSKPATSARLSHLDMSPSRLGSSSNVNSSNNTSSANMSNKLSNSASYSGSNTPGLRLPKSISGNLSTNRQMSVTSIDDDASTTTSGSYVINPDDVRMETMVGSDIIV